ncbi:hypothetical protein FS749_007784 [Ceratobasidium sp. UAMH 11750]|nr:hypothetical protein FS749_007784 [Ceratobasidium sp. UAMH 11750]
MYIDGLPTEVLSLIFTSIVGASLYARSIGDKGYGSIDCPTLLTSICARWRRVAIGIPALWSYIDFTRNFDSVGNLEHAKLYAERSQDSPLHIHLGKFPGEDDDTPTSPVRQVFEDTLSLLRTIAPRVQSFALNFSHSEDATETLSVFLSQVVEYPLPRLALRFERSFLGDDQSWILEEHWGQLFKPLKALYLAGLPMNPQYTNCHNLVELHMTSLFADPRVSAGPTVVQIRQLLNANPNLHSIKLSGPSIMRVPASVGTQQIHLPSLRRLSLDIDETFINWLLTSVVSGSHQLELYLNCSGLHRDEKITIKNTLVAFFQWTPVRSLHLSGRWVLLPPILVHLPHLQRLSLTVYDFDQDTLDGVEGLTSTLANLHTIELNECNMHSYSQLDQGLKTLLTFPSVQQIKHFRCGDDLAPGVQERFHKLLKEDQDITARIIEAPKLAGEVCPSPFR